MRVIFTLLLIGLCFTVQCQVSQRTITGTLLDDTGQPLPGINILVKGTQIGTTTDVDGNYSITAPVGSTLVFSFIGMVSREVIVTADNFQSGDSKKEKRQIKNTDLPRWSPLLMQDTIAAPEEGVAILSDETPIYFHDLGNFDPSKIRRINSLPQKRTSRKIGMNVPAKGYVLKTASDEYVERTAIEYSLNIGIDRANKLPSLQNQFAQGRQENGKLQWRGADQQEIFSWGPRITTLEYDGSNYPYDVRGRLVSLGDGTGVRAKPTDPLTFFKTGKHVEHFLSVSSQGPLSSTVLAELGRNNLSGIIDQSGYTRTNLSLQLKKFKLSKRLDGDAITGLYFSDGTLMNHGANLTSIVGAVYRTPNSFDNTNGSSSRMAYHNKNAFRFADNSVRSHAPGIVDNPFGLNAELPDEDKYKRLLSGLTLRYTLNSQIEFKTSANLEKQWNNSVYGLMPGHTGYTDGRLTRREDVQTVFTGMIMPSLNVRNFSDIKVDVMYQIHHEDRALNRSDAFGLNPITPLDFSTAENVTNLDVNLNRTTHEIMLNGRYELSEVTFKAGNVTYFSNTLSSKQYTNFFPSVGFSIIPTNFSSVSIHPIDHIKAYGSWARSMHEAALIYGNQSYRSTVLPAMDYSRHYESREVFFSTGLSPEIESKFEAGISVNANHLSFEASFYRNVTSDLIAPVRSGYDFQLMNIAEVVNSGSNLSLAFDSFWTHNVRWGATLGFHQYDNHVKDLYSDDPFIPLAGFQTTASVFAEGEALGAIFGSTYLRNENGDRVIGADGFPLVDWSMKKIGNPNPDFTMSLRPTAEYQQFELQMLFEYRKGGDVWNGTQGVLDFLGRSQNTAALRSTSDYIFEGINTDGTLNTTPVAFHDATRPIEENRWVRYGFTGVGEEYIEEASFFRMTELSIGYRSTTAFNKWIKQLKIRFTVRNVFLSTPYSGVDPSTALFGSASAKGLDLFNTPATRSFSLLLNVKF